MEDGGVSAGAGGVVGLFMWGMNESTRPVLTEGGVSKNSRRARTIRHIPPIGRATKAEPGPPAGTAANSHTLIDAV